MRCLALILVLIAAPVDAQQIPRSVADVQLGFFPVVKQAVPTVVHIYAEVVREIRRTLLQMDPFFLGDSATDPELRVQNPLGSGAILSRDGIGRSNYYVVGMTMDNYVMVDDRRDFNARDFLVDEKSDLPIVKIDTSDPLLFAPLRANSAAELSEMVLAIRKPYVVGQTVSSEIVSGLTHSGGSGGRGHGNCIQMKAPINLGGALVVMAGQLTGTNLIQEAGLEVRDVPLSAGGQQVNTPFEMIHRMNVLVLEAEGKVPFRRPGVAQNTRAAVVKAPELPPRDEKTLPQCSLLPSLTRARIKTAVLAELDLPLDVEAVEVMDVVPFASLTERRIGDVIKKPNDILVIRADEATGFPAGDVQGIQMMVQRGVTSLHPVQDIEHG